MSKETSLGMLLNNDVPDMRREVLRHLGDKDFMRACLLSRSTIRANVHELQERHDEASHNRDKVNNEMDNEYTRFQETIDTIPLSVNSVSHLSTRVETSNTFLIKYNLLYDKYRTFSRQATNLRHSVRSAMLWQRGLYYDSSTKRYGTIPNSEFVALV